MRDTCPECQEPLVVYEMEGVEIDRLSSHELYELYERLGELAMLTEIAGVEPGNLTHALEHAREGSRTKRRCPRCGKKLRLIHIGKQSDIELDRCPRGHGLWLDAGEMEAVIRSYAEGEEGSVARFFSDLLHSELDTDRSE